MQEHVRELLDGNHLNYSNNTNNEEETIPTNNVEEENIDINEVKEA